ncbi:MAG: 4Fe-4S binding protein [Anaerolineae bacterium]
MAKKKKSTPPTIWARRAVQTSFALFILVSAYLHFADKGTNPSLDALCPFGAVETLWTYLTAGHFLPKTSVANVILAIGLFVGTFVVGGAFCGWVCPFGALQDALTWLQKKLHLPKVQVPAKWDKILSYGRFVVLAVIIYMSATTATLWFADYDPYRTVFSLHWLFDFNTAAWLGYAIAVVLLVGGLFIPRLWCRYMCPLGGLIGLVQHLSPIKIRRDAEVCIDCGLCDRVCPMRLSVATATAVSGDCIACLECVERCPVKGSLNVSLGKLQPVVSGSSRYETQ